MNKYIYSILIIHYRARFLCHWQTEEKRKNEQKAPLVKTNNRFIRQDRAFILTLFPLRVPEVIKYRCIDDNSNCDHHR